MTIRLTAGIAAAACLAALTVPARAADGSCSEIGRVLELTGHEITIGGKGTVTIDGESYCTGFYDNPLPIRARTEEGGPTFGEGYVIPFLPRSSATVGSQPGGNLTLGEWRGSRSGGLFVPQTPLDRPGDFRSVSDLEGGQLALNGPVDLVLAGGRPSNRALIATSGPVQAPAVPEPGVWACIILGFGVMGARLRRINGRRTSLPCTA